MMLACFGGHLKVALQLFEQGASIDSKDNGGSYCIHWAVDGSKTDCIQWLLDNGVNVRAVVVPKSVHCMIAGANLSSTS